MQLSIADTIVLAIIQGLTEFLPVSSSGHLVLAETLLGVRGNDIYTGVTFEVAVHVGTLGAILVVYREKVAGIINSFISFLCAGFRLNKQNRGGMRYLVFIILGSIPAVLVGLFVYDIIMESFRSPLITAVCLIATGIFLLFSRGRGEIEASGIQAGTSGNGISSTIDSEGDNFPATLRGSVLRTAGMVLMIGIAQSIAILPGCSRSGWTITTALLLGLSFSKSAEFSFLLSIPAILGALFLEVLKNPESFSGGDHRALIIGAVTAFLSGWLAIKILLAVLKRGGLHRFSYYLIPLGVIAFLFFAFGG